MGPSLEDNFPAATRFREAELSLRSGTDDYLVHINIGRLLDRERNSAGDRIRRQRELVSGVGELGFHLRICHRFRIAYLVNEWLTRSITG